MVGHDARFRRHAGLASAGAQVDGEYWLVSGEAFWYELWKRNIHIGIHSCCGEKTNPPRLRFKGPPAFACICILLHVHVHVPLRSTTSAGSILRFRLQCREGASSPG
jgi:hypothetical protein